MRKHETWAEIGRRLRHTLSGLSRAERLDRLRIEAQALGKATHTLQRYLHLLAFYEGLKLTEREINTLPIAPSEVILRLHEIDETAALEALAELRTGHVTYQQLLARMRTVQPLKGQPSAPRLPKPVAARILTALGMNEPASLVVAEAGSCPSTLSDPSIIYRAGDRPVAILSEAMLQKKAKRGLRLFAREAIVAAAEFDEVVILFSASRSLAKFEALTRHLRPPVKDRFLHLLIGEI